MSIAAAPTPVQPLRVVQQGFGQLRHQLSYAFVVENPNSNVAFQTVGFHVLLLNAAGVVVQTESGTLGLVLPGQQLGEAGMDSLLRDDTVAGVEVALQQSTPLPAGAEPAFAAEQLSYTPGLDLGSAAGVLNNPFDAAFATLLVSAIAYDAGGRIIGGGFTVLALLPEQGRARAVVPVLGTAPPARVALFPQLNTLADLAGTAGSPAVPGDLQVLDQGFGVRGGRVGYGLLLQNVSSTLAYDGVRYRVIFYDAAGVVLDSFVANPAKDQPRRANRPR